MPLDEPLERFDVVDPATGAVVGTAPRSECHATGLWHRSVYVFVTDTSGRHLLQQRAATKDVCPNLWDMACTEHVAAGETVRAAAIRGCREELGVVVDDDRLGTPLGPERRSELKQGAVWDRELVTTFLIRGWDGGAIEPDATEVAATRWATAAEVRALVAAGETTPWLAAELEARPELLE
jgi:isopentenyl-diphosphate Delta-isomerase